MTEKPSADEFFKSIRKCLETTKIGGENILCFTHKCIAKEIGLKNSGSSIYATEEFLKALYRFSKRYDITYIIFIDRPGNQGSKSYLISSEYENVGLSIIESRMLNSSNGISLYKPTDKGLERVLHIHGKPNRYPCTYCSFYDNGYCKLYEISNPEKIRDKCKCYIDYDSSLGDPKLDELVKRYAQLCRETYEIVNF